MGNGAVAGLEATGLSAARLRIAVARLSRRLRPTAAAGSLTPSEVDVLRAAAREGPTRLSDLASFVGLNPTMLSRLIPKLEASGLVRRQEHESDRRVCLLGISAKGERLLERISRERDDALSVRIAELDPADIEALAKALPALERLVEAVANRPAGPGPRA